MAFIPFWRDCDAVPWAAVKIWLTLMCRMHVWVSLGGGEAGWVESMLIDLRGLRDAVHGVA